MRTIVLAVLPLAVAACERSPCLEYTSAFDSCIDQAIANGVLVDAGISDPRGFCEAFEETPDETFLCFTEVYVAADCSTQAGVAGADADTAPCGALR